MKIIKECENDNSLYRLAIDNGAYFISRIVKATGAMTRFGYYMFIDRRGDAFIKKITGGIAERIVKQALVEDNLSSALTVIEDICQKVDLNFQGKGRLERMYTSTGEKFLSHPQAIASFKTGGGKTIISTHISPEGKCNLKCPYCSVAYRTMFNRISLDRIKNYIHVLRSRGLKAAILTGGGEPTLYPQINELIEFIHDECGLQLAMITNGTTLDRVHPHNRRKFEWLRVSVNIFKDWKKKINIPREFSAAETVIGMSYIMTAEHDYTGNNIRLKDVINDIIHLMDKFNVTYLRILPNCLIKGDKFYYHHQVIARFVASFNDPRIFHQLKTHETPDYSICYQSYFRPYLSEERNPWDHEPGCVFPCDSLVLNDSIKKFTSKYALCQPEKVGDFLDKKTKASFDPQVDCLGCVFVNNNRLLADAINEKDKSIEDYSTEKKILHRNFV